VNSLVSHLAAVISAPLAHYRPSLLIFQ